MESVAEHYDAMVKAIQTYTPSADMLRINAAVDACEEYAASHK